MLTSRVGGGGALVHVQDQKHNLHPGHKKTGHVRSCVKKRILLASCPRERLGATLPSSHSSYICKGWIDLLPRQKLLKEQRWRQQAASFSSSPNSGHNNRRGLVHNLLSFISDAALSTLRQQMYPLVDFVTKYHEILQRLAVTIAMLTILRLGMFIPLPGVDTTQLQPSTTSSEGDRLIRALYGQAQALPASLFNLGISPYINASIVITVLLVLPTELFTFQWLSRLKEARKEGKSGEAFINTWINMLSLLFALYLACVRAVELEPVALFSQGFIGCTVLTLVAGSCIVHFCANMITAHGIGNGSTLVICTGIVTEYAETLHMILTGLETGVMDAIRLAVVTVVYLSLVLFAVYLNSSELRLPIVQYSTAAPAPSKAISSGDDGDMFARVRAAAQRKAAKRSQRADYFPLQMNTQGMMPIIFAGALYFGFLPRIVELLGWQALGAHLAAVQSSMWGLLYYGLLVFCMEFVPVGGINPKEVAEYLGLMNVGIKGVVPGEATEKHILQQLLKCKFWGGLALGSLAVVAYLFDTLCQAYIGTTLATTSLLIIVGAVMQTSRQVESLLEGPRLQEKLQGEQSLIQSLRVL